MNKTELISSITEETGLSRKHVELALSSALSVIADSLSKGDKVQLVGFGTFETKDRAERLGRNPKTGEDVIIPASRVPVFKAGKALKESVSL